MTGMSGTPDEGPAPDLKGHASYRAMRASETHSKRQINGVAHTKHPLYPALSYIVRYHGEWYQTICDEWANGPDGMVAFIEHVEATVGPRPPYSRLVPKDPELGYRPFNVKWEPKPLNRKAKWAAYRRECGT